MVILSCTCRGEVMMTLLPTTISQVSPPHPTVVFSVIVTPALLCLVNTLCTTQLQCLLLPPALPVGHLLRGRAAAANFFHHLPEGGHLHWGGWGWWSHRG